MRVGGNTTWTLHEAFRSHDRKAAWQTWLELRKKRRSLTRVFQHDDFSQILQFTVAHTIPEKAARYSSFVLQDMRRAKRLPDLRDYRAIMSIQLRVGDVRKITQLFQELVEQGLEPDVKIYTILLASYSKTKNKNLLWTTWEQMVERLPGSEVDMDARSVMVEALGRAGDVSGAEMLVEDIERALRRRNGGVKEEGRTLLADIQLYEAMIRAYGVTGQLQAAMRNFRTLVVERPDFGKRGAVGLNTFDAVLEACAVNDDFESALEFWNSLVDRCKEISTAHPPLDSAPKKRPYMLPRPTSYDYMMSLYAARGDVERVRALFDEKRAWYQPDVAMFRHLINVHLRKEQMKEAVGVYDEMVGMGLMPDVDTVEAVMRAKRSGW
ncbi:hypothetical protein HK097_006452 [Rhizophlyctis rosea]|uniref:Pentatricopeptide repeat-containing protein n=1 Tax=Rhizophlyctis rosea TaxID=64517 RepID=A0AAD5WZ37_9FUNG|nr:hypothetical protein HK097_006452 [Rhizophlyctis rosea]